jgi:hypothetical protein
VWTPTNVAVGWAPYRYGHWAWVSPWGWTWIDDAPWGFAPFHYGRWAYAGNRWVWVPGAVAARPVYAPALVVFIGGDGDSVDTVTWFPLAPREVYVPSYTVSSVYMRQINITHVTNVQEIERVNVRQVVYANRRTPQAVTMVPRQAFVGSAPVSRSVMSVAGRDMDREPVVGMGVSVAPQRESVMGQSLLPSAAVRRPPASVSGRNVYSQTAPAAAPERFVPGRIPQTDNRQTPRRDTPAASPQGGTSTGRSGLTILTPASRGRTQTAQDDRTQATPPGVTRTGQDDQTQATPAGRTQATPTGRTQATPGGRTQATPPGGTQTAPDDRGGNKSPNQADQNRARSLITTLKTQTLPQVDSRLSSARSNKAVKLDFNSLSQQIASARSTLADAERDLQAGNTDQAMQKAQAVQRQLADIQRIIDDATKSAGSSPGNTAQPGRTAPQGRTTATPAVKPARKP